MLNVVWTNTEYPNSQVVYSWQNSKLNLLIFYEVGKKLSKKLSLDNHYCSSFNKTPQTSYLLVKMCHLPWIPKVSPQQVWQHRIFNALFIPNYICQEKRTLPEKKGFISLQVTMFRGNIANINLEFIFLTRTWHTSKSGWQLRWTGNCQGWTIQFWT